MQDIRAVIKAQRQSKLEAYQCPSCRRWFSTTKGHRTHCFRCECLEEDQGTASNRKKAVPGVCL